MASPVETSAFSPRLDPRPQYPSVVVVFLKAVRVYLHDVILGCLLMILAWGPYQNLHQTLGWSDRQFYALTLAGVHSFAWLAFNGTVLLLESFGWLQDHKIGRKEPEV